MISARRRQGLASALALVFLFGVSSAGGATTGPLIDGTPLAEFEVVWDGWLSRSKLAADDSQTGSHSRHLAV
jgi:hypothetical protein